MNEAGEISKGWGPGAAAPHKHCSRALQCYFLLSARSASSLLYCCIPQHSKTAAQPVPAPRAPSSTPSSTPYLSLRLVCLLHC